MSESLFALDPDRPFHEQERLGHNRWHPEIPPVATARPRETFRVDCRDWFDGHVRNDESAEDVLTAPFGIRPSTSGPHQVVSDLHPPCADAGQLSDDDILRAVLKDKKALLPAARRLGGQAAQPVSAVFGKLRGLLGRGGK